MIGAVSLGISLSSFDFSLATVGSTSETEDPTSRDEARPPVDTAAAAKVAAGAAATEDGVDASSIGPTWEVAEEAFLAGALAVGCQPP